MYVLFLTYFVPINLMFPVVPGKRQSAAYWGILIRHFFNILSFCFNADYRTLFYDVILLAPQARAEVRMECANDL